MLVNVIARQRLGSPLQLVRKACSSVVVRCVAVGPQVGTSDGRVKIIGREGVEAAVASFSQSGTQHIEFLHNRGVILRLNQVRDTSHD